MRRSQKRIEGGDTQVINERPNTRRSQKRIEGIPAPNAGAGGLGLGMEDLKRELKAELNKQPLECEVGGWVEDLKRELKESCMG